VPFGRPRLRIWPLFRRGLLVIGLTQLSIALGLTLVDSWRRRGRKTEPFPVTPPDEVEVGTGSVTPYTYGDDLYRDMLTEIESAKSEILLETYIWKDDEVGRRFKDAVEAAARRGVDVFVVYDAFANLVVPPAFKQFSPAIRVLAYPVYPAGWRFYDLRRYGRDHRKILVVDDRVAFVGGYNIGTAYATEWRDTHAKVTGPAVWDLKRAFVDFWNMQARVGRGPGPLLHVESPDEWDPRVRLQRNVPRLWMFPIRAMYLEAMDRARHSIYLTQAYFIPDDDFVDTLLAACARGVEVRLLLPAMSNHVVADWLSRGFYATLLEGGVHIHLYQGAMVHAKTATVDGRWCTIGTANIDRLSMTGNYEINVEFIDDGIARQMEDIFRRDLSNTEELTLAEWRSRGLARRFAEVVLAPLRPLL
jgi:cardiolipin synthase A/B